MRDRGAAALAFAFAFPFTFHFFFFFSVLFCLPWVRPSVRRGSAICKMSPGSFGMPRRDGIRLSAPGGGTWNMQHFCSSSSSTRNMFSIVAPCQARTYSNAPTPAPDGESAYWKTLSAVSRSAGVVAYVLVIPQRNPLLLTPCECI